MLKKQIIILLVALMLLTPSMAFALTMPQSGNELAELVGISARAYVVIDAETGDVLISKNADASWTAASLTKLVTALVVLDSKTKLTKRVIMTQQDQIAGGCSAGGACIASKPGVAFTVDGLFHAALMPSANNAANALSRSIGLTPAQFVKKMNEKAKELGATSSHFNEPTGMDPANKITALDYAKIVKATFSNSYLRSIGGLTKYSLRSTNNTKYNQTIKNTNKLLGDADINILGAKTGYLNESFYNFASLLTYRNGQKLSIVVLGEKRLASAFAETKMLATLAESARFLGFRVGPVVLGTSTVVSMSN